MFPRLLAPSLVLALSACAEPAASVEAKGPASVQTEVAPATAASAASIEIPGVASVGALEWRFNAGSTIPAAPAVGADGTLYVGTGDGTVQAIAPGGALRWSYTVEGAVPASPVIDTEGRVLVVTSAARVYAFWPTGQQAWALRLRAHVATDLVPSPAHGGVLLGTADGALWALSERGSPLWHTEAGAPLSSVLGSAGRRIVTATQAGDAVFFDGAVRRARVALGAAPRGTPVVFDDGSTALVAGSSLVRIGVDGSVAWRREGVAWVGGSAAMLLVVETARGGATVLTRVGADGKAHGSTALPGGASGPPIPGEKGRIYVSGDTGELWSVTEGEVARSRIARTSLHHPVLDPPRRRVIVAAGSGAIAVVEVSP